MQQRTDLSAGAINGSDRLSVELIEAAGQPADRGDQLAA